MKKNFSNLQPSKSKKKPTDEQIDKTMRELEGETVRKQKQIPFNVKLPENLYNALDAEAKKTGLSKKAILVSALWDKLG